MVDHNFERLKAHILPRSVAKDFESARSEWDLIYVEISDEPDHCPCGQQILEHCYIRNRLTHRETYVGNICINRFLGIDTGNLFDGLKRIRSDPSANANESVIEYARRKGFLYESEYQFLHSTKLKRKLSDRQVAWKVKINRRILSQTVVQRRTERSSG
ncbi:hypothetical protein QLH51_04135 [Sphingomonas sp. 2R-10]|uniref:hypothetical protein n=1 Tax=Sphingomonas sp. 2R-10 TaxID=3045148 RepID=UPI0024B8A518|nr:hypothetical protein [Sphingomonas sp. 2R-10]MDJ0275993.1 hypothetical protein [Sphingomonas sp. 2R-10]